MEYNHTIYMSNSFTITLTNSDLTADYIIHPTNLNENGSLAIIITKPDGKKHTTTFRPKDIVCIATEEI